MITFSELKLGKQLQYGIDDLGITHPTPIQEQSFSVIKAGKDMVGIAQTGTGKTFAYMLPVLETLKYSREINPRVLVLVPTRELVVQVVEEIEKLGKYLSVRVTGVYGGVNINTHKQAVAQGCDVVVATPGRLYDLALSRAVSLKNIKKLIIDEVDVMLDLGFRFQITNIFELLPERRQNILFSATMTDDVENLIDDFFKSPEKISVAVSGTPLDNIEQQSYVVKNFYTKANLLNHLLKDKEAFTKVLVFVPNKRQADTLYQVVDDFYPDQVSVIHSNKTQNYRLRSIENFNAGKKRILISTDVMSRGLDLDRITHVVNMDVPRYAENYMHRIGRTGRAEAQGKSILFSTEKEALLKEAIETLMDYTIPLIPIPEEVEVSDKLLPEERPQVHEPNNPHKVSDAHVPGASFHEKSEKNSKENRGGSYQYKIAAKYKKPKTRGDKNYNRRNKR
ncbi:possible ATP-dependent RNA helicase [unidentified eubacterium SCB49]|nr:possible ATP-dependent RNA helicase [unidentified eubacterium SCB49]